MSNELNSKAAAEQPSPLRSVHTSNFSKLLQQLRVSIAVTTYQAGKLVLLRAEGELLNTHFRCFNKPMGLAVEHHRLAIGTAIEVSEFHNLPAVAAKLDGAHPHDACFLPRTTHYTGDIQIHEMAWAGDDLLYLNTLFSCLCRRSPTYSFEPVWRPSFIDSYTPADCCHLNGLCVTDGVPRYVTALGESNEPAGWRANKRDGGILIDVDSHEIVTRGLSMPHSPRWHNGQLWLLESGTGSLGAIDLQTGRYAPIVTLPGFTRGLSFCGPLAFVGLSQIRETAVFANFPVAERALEERSCGVWVVDIRNGDVVAFVKFEDAVQEIFAVELLPDMNYPDLINDDAEIIGSSYELPDAALVDGPPLDRCSLKSS